MSRPLTLKELIEAEEALAQGESRAPVVSNSNSAHAKMSLFLRDYRSRPDYAQLLTFPKTGNFVETLESMRNALSTGDCSLAEAKLLELHPESDLEAAEAGIEHGRLLIYQNRIDEALSSLSELLNNPELTDLSRMTCLQMRGHCLILKRDYPQAVRELKLAATLSEFFPRAASSFSARAFLVQAYAELKLEEEAYHALSSLRSQLESLDDPELALDRMLTLIRAEVHLHRCFNQTAEKLYALYEAKEISRWLDDGITLERCKSEITDALAAIDTHEKLEIPVHEFSGWIFLPKRQLILGKAPKTISRLNKKPVLNQVLLALARGPLEMDQLFEQVWKARYHPEKHGTHMRVTLSNLRKMLPKGALEVEGGVVSLR
jgi:tetratricopeptide (TPR) repeat protein